MQRAVAAWAGPFCDGPPALIPPHSTLRLNDRAVSITLNHMVEQSPVALDRVFGALSDPTRRAMLRRLAGGPRTVGELAEPFEMSFAAAAKHVKVLEHAGLLSRTIEEAASRL